MILQLLREQISNRPNMNFTYEIIPIQETISPKTQKNQQSENKTLQRLTSKETPEQQGPKKKKPELLKIKFWTQIETSRYVKFLKKSKKILQYSIARKRRLKVNVKMSKAVRTRNATQCKAHHQKMLKKYGTLQRIINSLQGHANLTEAFLIRKINRQQKEEKKEMSDSLEEKNQVLSFQQLNLAFERGSQVDFE